MDNSLKERDEQFFYILFFISIKAMIIQLTECRKMMYFNTKHNNSIDFLAGRMQNLKNTEKGNVCWQCMKGKKTKINLKV